MTVHIANDGSSELGNLFCLSTPHLLACPPPRLVSQIKRCERLSLKPPILLTKRMFVMCLTLCKGKGSRRVRYQHIPLLQFRGKGALGLLSLPAGHRKTELSLFVVPRKVCHRVIHPQIHLLSPLCPRARTKKSTGIAASSRRFDCAQKRRSGVHAAAEEAVKRMQLPLQPTTT